MNLFKLFIVYSMALAVQTTYHLVGAKKETKKIQIIPGFEIEEKWINEIDSLSSRFSQELMKATKKSDAPSVLAILNSIARLDPEYMFELLEPQTIIDCMHFIYVKKNLQVYDYCIQLLFIKHSYIKKHREALLGDTYIPRIKEIPKKMYPALKQAGIKGFSLEDLH